MENEKSKREWLWSDETGFIDWNTLSMDQLVTHLEKKYMFSSSGDAYAIHRLIEFYKKHKENDK